MQQDAHRKAALGVRFFECDSCSATTAARQVVIP
jgi:hypothetical protein